MCANGIFTCDVYDFEMTTKKKKFVVIVPLYAETSLPEVGFVMVGAVTLLVV